MNAAMRAAEAFAEWLNTPENHDMGPVQLSELYGVARSSTRLWRHKLETGERNQYDKAYAYREVLLNNSRLGRSGEMAPCSSGDLSEETGVPYATIEKLRRQLGVLPFRRPHFADKKPTALYMGNYKLTKAEKRNFALCRMVTELWR